MAHSGGGEEATTPVEAQQPSSPVEIMQQPRVTFDLATMARCRSPEPQDSPMDEELQALGLWEEDMTVEQKVELLSPTRTGLSQNNWWATDTEVTAGVSVEVWNELAEFPGAVDGSTFDEFVSAGDDVAITGQLQAEDRPQAKATAIRKLMMAHCLHPSRASDEEDWPTPSSAKQSRSSRREPVLLKARSESATVASLLQSSVHRVYSMEHPLNLEFKKGDEAELEDARLSRLEQNAQGVAQDPTTLCNSGWKSPASALLESWASMHAALKQAQSSPELPFRPWTECKEMPPSVQDSRPREFGEPAGLVVPSMSAFSAPPLGKATVVVRPACGMSARGQDTCSSGESTSEIPGYDPDDWKTVRRRLKSKRQRCMGIRRSMPPREGTVCERDEKGPDLCSTSAMDASDT
ncbi:uncharacterized protein LOC119160764 isoform X3 [Rhipicephalus microplus]|uniref:uncharacterized protein LOC119160764 isoform X3 n=2 Tax=Rhipicephalus microplus TaxID=6941 RepID=UPI003F6D86B8